MPSAMKMRQSHSAEKVKQVYQCIEVAPVLAPCRFFCVEARIDLPE